MTPQEKMKVLMEAERIVLQPGVTPEQVHEAVAKVDALGDKEFSLAIRRTLKHERNHAC